MRGCETTNFTTEWNGKSLAHCVCVLQIMQHSAIRGVPRFAFLLCHHIIELLFKEVVKLFISCQVLHILAHDSMNHCHLERSDLFGSGFCFSD